MAEPAERAISLNQSGRASRIVRLGCICHQHLCEFEEVAFIYEPPAYEPSLSIAYALGRLAVLAILAGCSGPGSVVSSAPAASGPAAAHADATQRAPSLWVARGEPDSSPGFSLVGAASPGAVIVADTFHNAVKVFTPIGKLVAKITQLKWPDGLAVDPSGNVYIAESKGSDVRVYASDYKTLVATLVQPHTTPIGVAVENATGIVAVSNYGTKDGVGSVTFYAKGATTPCATVRDPKWDGMYFGAFDKAGNLYIEGIDLYRQLLVGVVTGGCSATAVTTLTTTNPISFPGGIQVTSSDKIAVGDEGVYPDTYSTIYTYDPPNGGALGAPMATTTLTGTYNLFGFSLAPGEQYVFGANDTSTDVVKYAYPGGGTALKFIGGFFSPESVVVVPAK